LSDDGENDEIQNAVNYKLNRPDIKYQAFNFKDMNKENIVLSWSGGKDSAMAFYQIEKDNSFKVNRLLTTLTQDYQRISMHGVRRELLLNQSQSLGVDLDEVFITKESTNSEYQQRMGQRLASYKDDNISKVAFGDIFLVDLKKYREDNLSKVNMTALFPIWMRDTKKMSREFVGLGFKAVISCIDSNFLTKDFVGREYNDSFLDDLPNGVDPCGENGEFHSFVYDGPIFSKKINVDKGEVVLRDNRFWYCDLTLAKPVQ